MIKVVCVVALVCALTVQGEDCFDKEKMKAELKKNLEECQEELELEDRKTEKMALGKCVVEKNGLTTADGKADYDKLVAKINSIFISESKKKIVLHALKDCKDKHPDLSEDFSRCYAAVFQKECSPMK